MDGAELDLGGGQLVHPKSSAQRLLERLDRPKGIGTLAEELGVSRQRIHQIVIRLLAARLVRSADPGRPTRIVVRAEDPTDLLTYDEERALSALPDEAATTIENLARRLGLAADAAGAIARGLVARGLVEEPGEAGDGVLLQLTPEGAAHPQRDPSAKRADLPRLPVRSDRVRSVLDYLVEKGPARSARVGQDLGIERHSMNALMQYLKRRSLVGKAGEAYDAPHEITNEGRRVRRELMRRTGKLDGSRG